MLTTFNQTAIASYKLMSTVNLQSIHHFLFLLLFMPLDSDNNVTYIFGYFCFMVCFVCLFLSLLSYDFGAVILVIYVADKEDAL